MRIAAPLLLAAAITFSARAQPAEPPTAPQPAAQPAKAGAAPNPDNDIIGSLLDPHHKLTAAEEEEPDTAGQTRTAPEADLPLSAGARTAPLPYAPPPPRSQRDRPVHVDETGKTPDGPPGERDVAYEARIRSSFAAAESFQGPLDGGWTLAEVRRGGVDVFAFQIVDRPDRLEAVWRDLRRPGSLNASGLVDDIQRAGSTLTLRFTAASTVSAVVTLSQTSDSRWTGRLVRGDEVFDVVLRRSGL